MRNTVLDTNDTVIKVRGKDGKETNLVMFVDYLKDWTKKPKRKKRMKIVT